jgi:hypothetical protein
MKALAPLTAALMLAAGLTGAAAAQPEGEVQAQNVIGGVIDALIGNRYNGGERQAIRRCGFAAVQRAENQYRPCFGNAPYAYHNYRGHVRVAAITDVRQRLLLTRVKGLLSTARGNYGGRGRADLSFRCDVARNGAISNLQVERTSYWRR